MRAEWHQSRLTLSSIVCSNNAQGRNAKDLETDKLFF